jgi:hypothetical protein
VFRFILERQPAETNRVATPKNESCQIAISVSETFSALPLPTAAEKSLNSDHVIVENNVTERQVINPSDRLVPTGGATACARVGSGRPVVATGRHG